MKLECIDCHAIVTGESAEAISTMEYHVRAAHNRELVFDAEAYTKPTGNVIVASALLPNPELIGAA